jgi:hypothetical protein
MDFAAPPSGSVQSGGLPMYENGHRPAPAARLQGRFILSISDCAETRAIFARFTIDEAQVTYSVAGYAGQKKNQGELIITPG